MQLRQIGTTGIEITPVAMGCWPITGITSVNVTRPESLATLTAAFDAGINFYDSAYVYGHNGESEQMIAETLGNHRDRIVIATKGGLHWEQGRTVKDGRPETIRRECEESLRRLRTDVIDLYYLHCPDPEVPVRETATAFCALRDSGKIRAVGVSNFSVAQLEEFSSVCPIDAMQPHYNMLQREIETTTLPWCASRDVSVMVYWPLLKGLLAGKLPRDHEFKEQDGRRKYPMFQGEEWQRNQDFVEDLRSIAARSDCSVAQLVIAWTIRQPGITAALCGARRPAQIEETAAAMQMVLPPPTLAEIDHALTIRGTSASRGAI